MSDLEEAAKEYNSSLKHNATVQEIFMAGAKWAQQKNQRLREALWPVTQLIDIGKKQVDLILGEGFVARCEAALEGKNEPCG